MVKIIPKPVAIAVIMPISPTIIPLRYGSDFLRPKLAPDESRKVLLGPGETAVTKLKIATDTSNPQLIG